jgi:hypothetical protein
MDIPSDAFMNLATATLNSRRNESIGRDPYSSDPEINHVLSHVGQIEHANSPSGKSYWACLEHERLDFINDHREKLKMKFNQLSDDKKRKNEK